MLPVAGTAPRAPKSSAGKISVSRPIITAKRSGTTRMNSLVFCRSPLESLTPRMFGTCGQPGDGVHVDLDAAARRRVVVQHHRQRRAFGDAAVVVEDLLLRRADEVRRDDGDAVGPFALGHLGQAHGFAGCLGAGAGEDRHALVDVGDGGRDRLPASRARRGHKTRCWCPGRRRRGRRRR